MAAIIRPAGGLPLTILAGIPGEQLDSVLKKMKQSCRQINGHSLRSFQVLSGLEGAHYRRHIINKTVHFVTEYVIQKREGKEAEKIYSPSHISIIYLESDSNAENILLLKSFMPFSQCIKIPRQNVPWSSLQPQELVSLFVQSIKNMPRWGNFQRMTCLSLPIRNFSYSKEQTLMEVCLERSQTNPGEPPITKAIIKHHPCNSEHRECPNCKNKSKEVPMDARGLCFVRGTHGFPRRQEDFPEQDKVLLDSLYRFGLPLERSEHFDVQFPRGKKLGIGMFQCVINGPSPALEAGSRSYVNIYPNDFVRVPKE